ncbi:hypothetical protein [Microbacterium aurum]
MSSVWTVVAGAGADGAPPSADVWSDVVAWMGRSDAASGGIALAATLAACVLIAVILRLRRRSRW